MTNIKYLVHLNQNMDLNDQHPINRIRIQLDRNRTWLSKSRFDSDGMILF